MEKTDFLLYIKEFRAKPYRIVFTDGKKFFVKLCGGFYDVTDSKNEFIKSSEVSSGVENGNQRYAHFRSNS